MELIAEFSDETLGFDKIDDPKYKVRRASRVVIINKEGKVALIYSTKQ